LTPGQIWEWHSTEEQKSQRSQETNFWKRMSIRRTTRATTMDFWRNILAVAQVAAAAAAINFEEVKSAPMARFHRVGEVIPSSQTPSTATSLSPLTWPN
jgi:hypothetical protein